MNEKDDPELPEQITMLKEKFRQFESASSQHRLYMTEYFTKLINRIDLAAEEYLIKRKKQTNTISKQTRSDQSKMVEAIKELQTELFGRELEEDQELLDNIRVIGLCLKDPISSEDVPGIGLKIQNMMLGLQRRVFMNKGLWFRVKEDSDGEDELGPKLFGTLFVLKDEFVSDVTSSDNLGFRYLIFAYYSVEISFIFYFLIF